MLTRRLLKMASSALAVTALMLHAGTGIASAHTGTTDPFGSGSVFTDIGAGRTAVDVGDAWFKRTASPTGESLSVHSHVPGGIDESHLCLSATPFIDRLPPGSCLNEGSWPGGEASFTVNLGTAYVGLPLYVQYHVVSQGETAYGGHADAIGRGEFFGNLLLPMSTSVPVIEGCESETAAIGSRSFDIVSGTTTTTVSDMTGNVVEGSTVTVTFTVAEGCTVPASLVAYQAPAPTFDATTADQQVVFDSDTGTFGPGQHTMTVTVPGCYFQVDFVRGAVIEQLGPAGSDNFYGVQGRLIDADNGGTQSCTSSVGGGDSTGGDTPPGGDDVAGDGGSAGGADVSCEAGMHGEDSDGDGVLDSCVADETAGGGDSAGGDGSGDDSAGGDEVLDSTDENQPGGDNAGGGNQSGGSGTGGDVVFGQVSTQQEALSGGSLARTGGDVLGLALAGFVLVLMGAALMLGDLRRRAVTTSC